MQLSPFAKIEAAPPDPILGLTEAFNADSNPNKVNLGVGVYQDETGRVPVLATVREAERRWLEKEDSKSYLPIDGVPAYNKAVQGLLFGTNAQVIAQGRAVTVQALGGTGALRVGADFLKRFFPQAKVWISNPSWENHRALFEAAGFIAMTYPYYDPVTHGLDFDAMMNAIREIPDGDILLLHASCHNPTGVDLSEAQWHELVAVLSAKQIIPFLDFAYQGFYRGIEEDAFAVRLFAQSGLGFLVASSFSKNFSLYRERVGALTIVTGDAEESKRVLSQVKRVIRTNWSNPSSHGAQVVALVLNDPELRQQWIQEVAQMRERIWKMRRLFVEKLREKGVGRDFGFIERQNGMFSFSGLEPEVVDRLRAEFSLYIVRSGRICIAAMNERNIDYICQAIAKVLRS
ncbi:MAG: aspartate/tyrosine/aromatic aminotransferase [Candidatus Sumerlaeaceae bacterium]|nr:aspartate/tyrosine/aromatic aminotransferase [Candidatus Sumerlaeaceae bacterium]